MGAFKKTKTRMLCLPLFLVLRDNLLGNKFIKLKTKTKKKSDTV